MGTSIAHGEDIPCCSILDMYTKVNTHQSSGTQLEPNVVCKMETYKRHVMPSMDWWPDRVGKHLHKLVTQFSSIPKPDETYQNPSSVITFRTHSLQLNEHCFIEARSTR